MSVELPFWERPEVVERFAAREPDRRMMAWLESRVPDHSRVLDVGCAAGRNTVWLAERGVEVFALDASQAMVARTRARLQPLIGEAEAARRVWRGTMDDLSRFDDGDFDLVLALGVLHAAQSEAEWDRAAAGIARVLLPGGDLLVAQFSPRTEPMGIPLSRVPGEGHLFEGFEAGQRLWLLEPAELDARMEFHGLVPVVPAEAVKVPFMQGHRVTVNGHFRRAM